MLAKDVMNVRVSVGPFNRCVELIAQLLKQRPRNQQRLNETAKTCRHLMGDVKVSPEKMRDRAKSGFYTRNGCSERDIAKATCIISDLKGRWRTIQAVGKLRDEAVFFLRRSRGSFANVDCSRL